MTYPKTVSADELKQWLDNNEAVVVDVREPGEYEIEHISNSTLIPLGNLSLDKLPNLDGKKLVIHCLLGKRGGMGCQKLIIENPNLDLYNLEGGITAWVNAGYQTIKKG
jgi:rhodanese-related sulfurtransferase